MNKDRQYIEHDIEHVTVLAINTIKYSLSVECILPCSFLTAHHHRLTLTYFRHFNYASCSGRHVVGFI